MTFSIFRIFIFTYLCWHIYAETGPATTIVIWCCCAMNEYHRLMYLNLKQDFEELLDAIKTYNRIQQGKVK